MFVYIVYILSNSDYHSVFLNQQKIYPDNIDKTESTQHGRKLRSYFQKSVQNGIVGVIAQIFCRFKACWYYVVRNDRIWLHCYCFLLPIPIFPAGTHPPSMSSRRKAFLFLGRWVRKSIRVFSTRRRVPQGARCQASPTPQRGICTSCATGRCVT